MFFLRVPRIFVVISTILGAACPASSRLKMHHAISAQARLSGRIDKACKNFLTWVGGNISVFRQSASFADWVLKNMIGLLQRVTEARVEVGGETIAAIGPGLLVLVGVERGDTVAEADRLLERLLGYRVFSDTAGKMNRSLRDVGGGLLLVPQFTLPADTGRGSRPSFTPAAAPDEGRRLFEHMVQRAASLHAHVGSGCFAADMRVALVNDGPVTFWLRVRPREGGVE